MPSGSLSCILKRRQKNKNAQNMKKRMQKRESVKMQNYDNLKTKKLKTGSHPYPQETTPESSLPHMNGPGKLVSTKTIDNLRIHISLLSVLNMFIFNNTILSNMSPSIKGESYRQSLPGRSPCRPGRDLEIYLIYLILKFASSFR